MKILVTGGAGFIGSNLVEKLVKDKNEVVVLDNLHSGSLTNLKDVMEKVQFVHGSCSNVYHFVGVPDVDLIIHLGMASSSPMYKENPLLFGDVINGAINVFEFAKKKGIKKVIYASSSSLYNSLNPPHHESMKIEVTDFYTEARLGVERIAQLYYNLYGITSVGLRLFSVYGMHEEAKGKYANIISQFLWEMQGGKSPVIYGNGEQRRDFTFVDDIVDAFTSFIPTDVGCEIYNVGTGISHSFNEVVEVLNAKLGTKITPAYIEMPMKNYVDRTLSDTIKMNGTGYRAKYTLETGIDKLLNAHKCVSKVR